MLPHKILLDDEELYCQECGTRLRSKGLVTRKAIMLDEDLHLTMTTIVYQRAVCPNPRCRHHNKNVVPQKLATIFLGNSPYTVDTTQKIVNLHDEEKQTYQDINDLTGIPISSAHNIYMHGLSLMESFESSSSLNSDSSDIKIIEKPEAIMAIRVPLSEGNREVQRIKHIGRSVSIDATTEKMSRTKLLVILDSQADEVLMTAVLKSATAQTYSTALDTLSSVYPVEYVTSDMEAALKKAIRETIRPVHYQYCHFHFLKNAGTKLMEESYNELQCLAQDVSREVKGIIYHLLGACNHVNDDGCRILSEFVYILNARPRSTTGDKTRWGDRAVPMFLSDLIKAKTLSDLVESVFEGVHSTRGVLGELRMRLMRLVSKVNMLREYVKEVSMRYDDFMKIRKMLADGGREVREHVLEYIASKKHLGVLLDYFTKYDAYLWHYVEVPEIPRTITELERFFGQIKRGIRGRNSIPGVSLDRIGLMLPFITGSGLNHKKKWSTLLQKNPQMIKRYKKQWRLHISQREKRRKQLRYDVALSHDDTRAELFRELVMKMNAITSQYK